MTPLSPQELAELLGLPAPTAEQAAVISAPLQPTLIVAGAGSGKTETIAARAVYLVANGLVTPEAILGLTFTRKAAGELGQRIRTRLDTLAQQLPGSIPADRPEPAVGTYHAFAGDLIEEFGPLVGVEPPRRVLTETETWLLARRVVTTWDGDLDLDAGPDRVATDLVRLGSALADHLADIDTLAEELARWPQHWSAAPAGARQRNPVHSKLAGPIERLTGRAHLLPLLREFDRRKRAESLVDFADQLRLAAQIVQRSPQVAQELRRRHRAVFLDEYQDTGHSQRLILRGLFGAARDGSTPPGHPVTAVGDPLQSIYAWRGASEANLPRFTTDFPLDADHPAPVRQLQISFRNARSVLAAANDVSRSLRDGAVPVEELRAAPGAPAGQVRAAVTATVDAEQEWVARAIRETVEAVTIDGAAAPTCAVLVRRRADMAGLAAALRAEGLPVQVVGVGGLVDEPEVADAIALLRLVLDHQAGPAAMRVLTGARHRLGLRDLVALARRARELGRRERAAAGVEEPEAIAADPDLDLDEAGIVDALADPGDSRRYSPAGYGRISDLAAMLQRLRSRLPCPLTELVIDIERESGLDVETLLRPHGREHMDRFLRVVADVATSGADAVELLDYLAAAKEQEGGLSTERAEERPGVVQISTIHSAKGLEWDIVALPHLALRVFPTDRLATWLSDAAELPPGLRGDGPSPLRHEPGADQAAIVQDIEAHVDRLRERRAGEERRLLYVALTRARQHLLLSAHHWGATSKRPHGPSEFFTELVRRPETEPDQGRPVARVIAEQWAPPPEPETRNPLLDRVVEEGWPVDPLGAARPAVTRAAALVRAADPGAEPPSGPAVDARGWEADVAALLAQRAARRAARAGQVVRPEAVSVSELSDLLDDPGSFADRLQRPLPTAPAAAARRGTAFHAWLEQRFGRESLLDVDELPGAHDRDAAPDDRLPELIAAFEASPWAAQSPVAVEVPFSTRIGDLSIRGRMDAVFRREGGYVVVDWKTGRIPTGRRARRAAIQLTAYRIAWARLRQVPLAEVDAVLHYVAQNRTVRPEELADAEELAAMIRRSTSP